MSRLRWYHWVLIAIVVAAGAYALFGLSGLLAAPAVAAAGKKEFAAEVKAINAGRVAADMAARIGHENTVVVIEREHAETIKNLDEKDDALRQKLRSNPKRLARMLSRASSRRRS